MRAWDASPARSTPIRWSQIAPAVLPKQTVISVDVADGEIVATGTASLTYYPDLDASRHDGLETSLAHWLGSAVRGVPAEPGDRANPYDPRDDPLRAVVELAVLDALGRETGLPSAAFFGGLYRTSIQAYGSLPSFENPYEAVECAVAAVAAGFNAVKFHASGLVEEDLQTIPLARRELGPTISLLWDASCAYDLYSATLIGRALADANFLWFEAPLADDSTASLRSLATLTTVPLVPDGLVQRATGDWARDVREGVWGALRLDVTRLPSVTSALRLLRLSEALGLSCEIQSFGFPLGQYANLQLMLATHACKFFEAPFPASDFEDGLVTAPQIVDGHAFAPEGSGLGHEIDVDQLTERCRPLAKLLSEGEQALNDTHDAPTWSYTDPREYLQHSRHGTESLPPLIVTVAITGGVQGQEVNPALPGNPRSRPRPRTRPGMPVQASCTCPRRPERLGAMSHATNRYLEINSLIRERCPDIVIDDTIAGDILDTPDGHGRFEWGSLDAAPRWSPSTVVPSPTV